MQLGFKEQRVREDIKTVPEPTENTIFYNCTFHKLNGAVLKDCTLTGSKFAMTKPEDIIGLTVTMDCKSFKDLELSPEVFDLLLMLLCRTKGNNAKRLAIIEQVVGHDKAIKILRDTEQLER